MPSVCPTEVTKAQVRRCVGVSLRRRLAIAVRSIGRDPHSAHLLPQDGYSRARNVCGLLDAGVVDLSHERLGPRESCHAHLCARRSLSSGHQHRGVIDVTTQLQRSLTPQRVRGLTNSPRLVQPRRASRMPNCRRSNRPLQYSGLVRCQQIESLRTGAPISVSFTGGLPGSSILAASRRRGSACLL